MAQTPRHNWPARLESIGFHFHSLDEFDQPVQTGGNHFIYWREDVAYQFSNEEIEKVHAAAFDLNQRCLEAVEHVIQKNLFSKLAISDEFANLIKKSWDRDDPTLYGRFDFTFGADGQPKMYEYNADTATSIIEAALAQWYWKEDVQPLADQFNSLHERFIDRWRFMRSHYPDVDLLHFACQFDSQEDICNVEYLMDTAVQAGFAVKIVDMKDIGITSSGDFVDLQNIPIRLIFKLFPWEWLATSSYKEQLFNDRCHWVEPPWKAVLSNKGILPILWDLFPGHPNLLEASFDAKHFGARSHAKKPIYSREGANVTLFTPQGIIESGGQYGQEGFIYQDYVPTIQIDSQHVTLGAWIIDDESVGMCVREAAGPIARNTSFFVPHYFVQD